MITITEALAEIKTIDARVVKKREAVLANLARDARMRDPMEEDGGSRQFIAQTLQSIQDLAERRIQLRTAIQRANHATSLTVEGKTRTIAEWLTWRREIADGQRQLLASMSQRIQAVREQAKRQGVAMAEADPGKADPVFVVYTSEGGLVRQIDELELVLGALDGRLSLINATTSID